MRILSALLATVAFAAPTWAQQAGNDAVIDQIGEDNTALIDQAGNGNMAGTELLPMLQDGIFNSLDIEQTGSGNEVGTRGTGLDQVGRANTAVTFNDIDIDQLSDGNLVGRVDQRSDGSVANGANTLVILQGGATGANDNAIVAVEQQQLSGTAAQTATLRQQGARNRIDQVTQRASTLGAGDPNVIDVAITGDDNGRIGLSGPAQVPLVQDSTLVQELRGTGDRRGQGNRIGLTITGDETRFGLRQAGRANLAEGIVVTGDRNEIGLRQDGDSNEITLGALDGDGNRIGVDQWGTNTTVVAVVGVGSDDNDVLVYQNGINDASVTITGSRSDLELRQDFLSGIGGRNLATIDIVGDETLLTVDQQGVNTLTLDVTGDRTNRAAFTRGRAGLTPGRIDQRGDGNAARGEIVGDDNVTAMLQDGDLNDILLRVTGRSNESEFLQSGDGNTARLMQNGTANRATFRQ